MASPTVYLLDTNILVHLIRGQRMARYVQARYGLNWDQRTAQSLDSAASPRSIYRQSTRPMVTAPRPLPVSVAMLFAFVPLGSQTTRWDFVSFFSSSSGLPS